MGDGLQVVVPPGLLRRAAQQLVGHGQDRLVPVPHRRLPGPEDDRVARRQGGQVGVGDQRFGTGGHRVRDPGVGPPADHPVHVLADLFRVDPGDVGLSTHLLQRLEHRVVGRLEEDDVGDVAQDDPVHVAVDVAELLQRLQDHRELLVLPEADAQHRFEAADAVPVGLQVAELVEHEPGAVQRLLVGLGQIGLVEVQVHQLLEQDQQQLGVLAQMRRGGDQEDRLRLLRVAHRGLDDRPGPAVHLLRDAAAGQVQPGSADTACRPACTSRRPVRGGAGVGRAEFAEDPVLDDLGAGDRFLDVVPAVQGELVALGEVEPEGPHQHPVLRVDQLQLQVRVIGREHPPLK